MVLSYFWHTDLLHVDGVEVLQWHFNTNLLQWAAIGQMFWWAFVHHHKKVFFYKKPIIYGRAELKIWNFLNGHDVRGLLFLIRNGAFE